MRSKLPASTLYNCCTNFAEPDWSQFAYLELAGCAEEDDMVEGLQEFDDSKFLTVYGRRKDGEAEAITDIPAITDAGQVLRVLTALTAKSGLKMGIHPTLFLEDFE